ncbi:hypothetical protein FA13DRAFT_1876418 [Coprinellus micaceus]|uniref:Uncharacterized protein n=1 Tax=Coprinellus micaceus TaxID=71717 RepID=A0A4Y7T168_COPMI|nr:hypothetical protein FA13DRAFT_1876418 [Coprinellus micaceus]
MLSKLRNRVVEMANAIECLNLQPWKVKVEIAATRSDFAGAVERSLCTLENTEPSFDQPLVLPAQIVKSKLDSRGVREEQRGALPTSRLPHQTPKDVFGKRDVGSQQKGHFKRAQNIPKDCRGIGFNVEEGKDEDFLPYFSGYASNTRQKLVMLLYRFVNFASLRLLRERSVRELSMLDDHTLDPTALTFPSLGFGDNKMWLRGNGCQDSRATLTGKRYNPRVDSDKLEVRLLTEPSSTFGGKKGAWVSPAKCAKCGRGTWGRSARRAVCPEGYEQRTNVVVTAAYKDELPTAKRDRE